MAQMGTVVLTAASLLAVAVAIASLVINIIILGNVQSTQTVVVQNNDNNGTCHYMPAPQYNSSTGTVSSKAGFQQAAAFLLNGLDDTVNPCDDFYAFTCNKFLNSVDLQKLGLGRLGTYDQSQVDVYNQVKAALNKIDVKDTTVSKTERITKAAFDTCLKNLGNVPNSASKVYKDLTSLFGGIPFLGEPLIKNIDFWRVAGQIEQQDAVGTLTYTIASSDYENHLQNALYVGPPALAMPRDYYVKPQFIDNLNGRAQDVADMMTAFAQALGKTVDKAAITNAANQVVNFEVLIAMATWPDDLLRNYRQQYNPYTITTAKKDYGSIQWHSYISALFNGVTTDEKTLNSYNIVVTQPSYFAWLNNIFNDVAAGQTVDPNAIANYMLIQTIFDAADFTGGFTRNVASKANYIHYPWRAGRGVTKIGRKDVRTLDASAPDFTQPCMDILTAYMPYGTGYVYVKSVAGRDQVRDDVSNQTDLIIKNFQGMIDTLGWMSVDSKNRAHNKSDSLVKNFGWPSDIFGDFKDFTAIDLYNQDYASIIDLYNKDATDIYDIVKVLKRGMEVREFFRIMNEPAKRNNFLQSPAMVNAWYQPERNSITFPYAAWNPPYYNFDFPQAYNYAGQGGTGGHELTHGYDDEGVQFGFNGELSDCAWNKCGWMDTSSSTGFINMAQCVVTQFSTQCCPEKTGNVHCANGATTQGENIADLGGQQAAYRAYREYVATVRNGVEEDRLPGLEAYTPNQIFWITYGYSWCMKQSDASLVRQLLTNPHSPAKCRTNQVMQDIPEFGRDFGCSRGDAMYPQPANRCKVWVGQ